MGAAPPTTGSPNGHLTPSTTDAGTAALKPPTDAVTDGSGPQSSKKRSGQLHTRPGGSTIKTRQQRPRAQHLALQAEQDQIDELDRTIANLETAVTDRATDLLRAGVESATIKLAVDALTSELQSARRHRAHLQGWLAAASAETQQYRRLRDLAEAARSRLLDMKPEEQAAVYQLLDLEVAVVNAHERRTPVSVQIQGAVTNRLLAAPADQLGHLRDATPRGRARHRGV